MNETEHTATAKECEDFLFPARSFTPRERALYYHLLRHTDLEGRPSALFALLPLANAIGVAESSVREDIRALHDRGCIRIEDKSRNGHLVRVLLPSEVPGVVPQTAPHEELDYESIDFFENRRYVVALLAREDGRCFYCMKGIRAESCELDHVVSQASIRNSSYRNIACSCHECNTTKQAQAPADFLRSLYRKGVLSQAELENRLAALELLQAGKLIPDLNLVRNVA
jgi:5-methylcytosine-specific restriction endonuclease McrA